MGRPLRSGYTTGACAAAAAKAAALLLRDAKMAETISIILPTGDTALFALHSSGITSTEASCSVIKDAGDDPDITNGAEVVAVVGSRVKGQGAKIIIEGGVGIGRVTKPGLAVPPGEWAINPVPRQMIEQAVREVFPDGSYQVVISIPDGEERAKKTLNARLGIIGGLSVLGTTGIVRPISAKAWTDTIDTAIDVAKACGCRTVVLCTGRTSELAAMECFRVKGQGSGVKMNLTEITLAPCPLPLPEEAFIMMGDHIAHALKSCAERGFTEPLLACQFGKLLKIACGHPNTHAAASEMDLSQLRRWAEEANLDQGILSLISAAHTAREIAVSSNYASALMELVKEKAAKAVATHTAAISPRFLVCGYDGKVKLAETSICY